MTESEERPTLQHLLRDVKSFICDVAEGRPTQTQIDRLSRLVDQAIEAATDERHEIWVWDGFYCEGHSAKGWSTGWFCMEADVDPKHPERGGVTPEDIEKTLREDMKFTPEEIAEARARDTVAYPDFWAWYAGLLTVMDGLIGLDGTENYQHLVEGYWVEQLAPKMAARVFLADENPDDDIPWETP